MTELRLFVVKSPIKDKYFPGTLLIVESANYTTKLDCFLKEEKKFQLTLIDSKSVEAELDQVEEIFLKRSKLSLGEI